MEKPATLKLAKHGAFLFMLISDVRFPHPQESNLYDLPVSR